MRNRHGVEYHYEKVSDNTFKFIMAEEGAMYMRVGGREGQDQIDMNNLGFFDPSGGPFVGIGSKIESGTVTRIMRTDEGILVEIENE
jgi:hypothetical protein